MKKLLLLVLLLAPSLAQANTLTLGGQAGFPDTLGVHLSYWPIDTLTLDAQATFASVDGGLTAHMGAEGPHHILITALGGWYTWHWDYVKATGTRITLQAGYGFEGAGWELRALLGANFVPHYGFAPAGTVMAGWLL